jgi:hypothetical protein
VAEMLEGRDRWKGSAAIGSEQVVRDKDD